MPLDATFSLTAKQAEARNLAGGEAMHLLFVGGSRSGKTFLCVRSVVIRAMSAPGSRHLIVRKAAVDCKTAIGGDTLRKVMALCYPSAVWSYNKQEGIIRLQNGSEIWLAGLDSHNLEKVLGNEYATIMVNEASQIPFATFETLKTRLAQLVHSMGRQEEDGPIIDLGPLPLRYYVDLNPTTRAHWTYRMWIDLVHPEENNPLDPSNYAHIFMNPTDNLANLPAAYVNELQQMGARMRKRFYEGQYVADLDEALWRRSMILRTQREIKDLDRIVVALDPATTNNPGSNETGIMAMGVDSDKLGYLLADESGKYRPEEWARIALALHRDLKADFIIAESNQGGQMVESMILAMWVQADKEQPGSYGIAPKVRLVHASKGKTIRAEPIAGLYERRKIYHVGEYPELEDQMCAFTIDFDRKAEGYSPDRVDALVWGFTGLFGELTKKKPPKDPRPQRPAPQGAGGWMGA